MTLNKAKKKFREFHLKDPREIIPIDIQIPRSLYPIGYAVQISYRSDKWNDDERWIDYIHWWENPTLVCVPDYMLEELNVGFRMANPRQRVFDLGPRRNEVTCLGHAIDFNVSEDDRSIIELPREYSPTQMEDELEKIEGSTAFPFSPTPNKSRDFVCCSPNGRIVYIVSEDQDQVFAFIGNKVRVTSHGIEG
jgi:hypothetical protein